MCTSLLKKGRAVTPLVNAMFNFSDTRITSYVGTQRNTKEVFEKLGASDLRNGKTYLLPHKARLTLQHSNFDLPFSAIM